MPQLKGCSSPCFSLIQRTSGCDPTEIRACLTTSLHTCTCVHAESTLCPKNLSGKSKYWLPLDLHVTQVVVSDLPDWKLSHFSKESEEDTSGESGETGLVLASSCSKPHCIKTNLSFPWLLGFIQFLLSGELQNYSWCRRVNFKAQNKCYVLECNIKSSVTLKIFNSMKWIIPPWFYTTM